MNRLQDDLFPETINKIHSIRNKYGSSEQFAALFSPDIQSKCAMDLCRTFTGSAPSLAIVRQAYGEGPTLGWIEIQITNLIQFCHLKSLSARQTAEIASMILASYYYLKVSEIALFFYKFKSGDYGKVYGQIDPISLMSALSEFKKFRAEQLAIFERDVNTKKINERFDEWNKKAVPCPDHLELAKKYFNEINK